MTESMPQIAWAAREDGWNLHFSRRWMEDTGLTPEESQGYEWTKPSLRRTSARGQDLGFPSPTPSLQGSAASFPWRRPSAIGPRSAWRYRRHATTA